MKASEVAALLFFGIFAIVGWVLFIVFYSDWQAPHFSAETNKKWFWASVGLYTGIACSAIFVIIAFAVGAAEIRRRAQRPKQV